MSCVVRESLSAYFIQLTFRYQDTLTPFRNVTIFQTTLVYGSSYVLDLRANHLESHLPSLRCCYLPVGFHLWDLQCSWLMCPSVWSPSPTHAVVVTMKCPWSERTIEEDRRIPAFSWPLPRRTPGHMDLKNCNISDFVCSVGCSHNHLLGCHIRDAKTPETSEDREPDESQRVVMDGEIHENGEHCSRRIRSTSSWKPNVNEVVQESYGLV